MRQKFKKEISSLDNIFEFIQDFFAQEQISIEHLYPVYLAVEELFTNMVKYSPETQNDILVELDKANERLTAILIDYDVKLFDITRLEEVQTDLPLSERKVGGLGIHLTKKMADDLRYEYSGRNSRITFIKNLR